MVQVEVLAQLEREAAALLLRAECARILLTSIGPEYRAFFSWLLRAVQSLEYESAGQEGAGQAPAVAGGVVDDGWVHQVLHFLEGQLLNDRLGAELQVGVWGLGNGSGSVRCDSYQ
jgi:hypothetical protein